MANTLQKGLIFHAPLDGEHLAKDVTPYSNHGTINGATLSTGRKGESEGSYSFDGIDDYINFGDIDRDIANGYTLSAFVKSSVRLATLADRSTAF